MTIRILFGIARWQFNPFQLLMLIIIVANVPVDTIRIVRYFHNQQHQQPDVEFIQGIIGTNLTLYCKIILETNDQLYSLKWYRQLNGTYQEFFSYITSPNRTIHRKTLPGVRMHLLDNADGQIIHLINVNIDTEGIYRCEVISDDFFQVDRKEFNLSILASPIERPRIIFTRRTYSLGERVQLKCISGIILPTAQLRWYISNVAVPESNESISWMLNVYNCQTINHWPDRLNKLKLDLSSSLNDTGQSPLKHVKICKISILSFILANEHLSKGSNHFTVRCVSTIKTEKFLAKQDRPIGNRADENRKETSSSIDFNVASIANYPTSPIIIGHKNQYQIGDIITIKCLLSPVIPFEDALIEWRINGQKIDSSKVKMNPDGTSTLCLRLTSRYIDKFGQLSLKCSRIQKWPFEYRAKNIGQQQNRKNHYQNRMDTNNETNLTNMKNASLNGTNFLENISQQWNTTETFRSFGAALLPIAAIIAIIIAGG